MIDGSRNARKEVRMQGRKEEHKDERIQGS